MGSRPAVPSEARRAAAEALHGSGLKRRGHNDWTRTTPEAVGVVSLNAMWLADDVTGVQAGAHAIPAVLPRLLAQFVGDGHNAQGIAWMVDQRDFGAPEFFPFAEPAVGQRSVQELQTVLRDHCVPAVDRVLADGALHAHVRAQVLAEEPFEGGFAMVRAAAVLLNDGDINLATAAVRRYTATEARRHAGYTSKPWHFPGSLMEELLALHEAFPKFDPEAAAAQGASSPHEG